MNFFARLSADHRLAGWCIVFALSIPPVLGALGVRIVEPVNQDWVPQHVADELKRSQRLFSFNAPVVLVLQSDDMFTEERIRAVQETVAVLRAMPEVEHLTWVGDIPEVTLRGAQTLLLPGPDPPPTQENLDAARTVLQNHPLAINSLISADGRTFLLLVDCREREHVAVITSRAKERLEPVGIRCRVTGNLALYALHDLSLEQDHLRIQVLANLLVIILAVVIFRRPSAIFIAFTGPMIGVGWTLGWLNLIGQSENELAKIILPVMVMMIGFTDGVHLVMRIRQLRGVGVNHRDSVYGAVMHIGPACFLTSLTTAIGFGSLIISDSEMISGFGRVSAIGVVVTFFSVVLVIPLLSHSWVGRNMHVQASQDPIVQFMNYCVGIISFSSRHAVLVTIAGFAITGGCLYLSLLLVPDDRISDRIPHDSEEWAAMRFADENLGGIRNLQLIITWPEEASRNDVWAVVRECEDILSNEELIGSVTSIRTTLTVFRGPDRRDNSVLVNQLPEAWRARFYRPEIRRTQVVARLQDSGIAHLEPMFGRIDRQIAQLEQRFPGMEIEQVSDQAVEGRTIRK
ncbi:MAG: MMPL family transporter [Planctomycetaceae bacterium]